MTARAPRRRERTPEGPDARGARGERPRGEAARGERPRGEGTRYAVPEARGDVQLPEERLAPGAHEGEPSVGLRIHKAMAQAGLASRREAERMIAAGQVRLNGQTVRQPGRLLAAGDVLEVDGRAVAWEREAVHELWALYKPKACVCTLSDPQGRRTVKDFFPRSEQRLFPVGRLDYDAEGLLLLTNDGSLAQRVTHPSFGMPRVYLVKVKGEIGASTLHKLAQGIELEGQKRQPARTRILHTVNDKTWVEVILREGIQHHLKKMFQAVGHPVLKIKRYQVGPIELGDLRPGQSRKLGRADIERLMHWADTPRGGKRRAGAAAEDLPRLKLPAEELARP
jgi:23S rRNA pseudouridine2605 synthase